jgi:hypothetical protein
MLYSVLQYEAVADKEKSRIIGINFRDVSSKLIRNQLGAHAAHIASRIPIGIIIKSFLRFTIFGFMSLSGSCFEKAAFGCNINFPETARGA